MKKHDYAGALERLNEQCPDYGQFTDCKSQKNFDVETIRHALRFAEKMMQEPSEGMVSALKTYAIVPKPVDAINLLINTALKELGE